MVGVVLVHVGVEHHAGVRDADFPSRLRSVQQKGRDNQMGDVSQRLFFLACFVITGARFQINELFVCAV